MIAIMLVLMKKNQAECQTFMHGEDEDDEERRVTFISIYLKLTKLYFSFCFCTEFCAVACDQLLCATLYRVYNAHLCCCLPVHTV
jgi:hypothetical protein